MGESTKISWCHATFNPWRGCSHAVFPPGHPRAGEPHPGCLNCYAEFLVCDMFKMGGVKGEWGPGAPRTVAKDSGWAEPLKWARAAAEAGERRRVFFSLGDPLDEEAPKDAQARLWQLIRETAAPGYPGAEEDLEDPREVGYPTQSPPPPGGLDWLLLTKRPWRWEVIPEDVRPLVWLGTSVSDQPTADVWLSALMKARGFRLLFCSYEPALGPVDFAPWLSGWTGRGSGLPSPLASALEALPDLGRLSWLIWGGESGANRRPGEVSWGQAAADQCAAADVAFYAKQDTVFRAGQQGRIPDALWARKEVPR